MKEQPVTPEEVKQLRSMLGLTQRDLARLIHVDGVRISQWEQGHVRPSGPHMEALIALREAVMGSTGRRLAHAQSKLANVLKAAATGAAILGGLWIVLKLLSGSKEK